MSKRNLFIIAFFSLISSGCSVSALIEQLDLQSANTISLDTSSPYGFAKASIHAAATDKSIVFRNNTDKAVSNLGATLSFSTDSLVNTPFDFKGGSFPGTGGTCAPSVAANTECTFVLEYAPSLVQVDGGKVTLNYDWDSQAQILELELSGTGVEPAILAISDGLTYDFGSVNVGSSSATKTFTVTNTGGVADAVMESSLTTPFVYEGGAYPGTGGDCGTTIAAGDSCTLVIKFTPLIAGLATGSIALSYNDGLVARSADRDVEGTGVMPNVAPVADDQTLSSVIAETATAITLTATDGNGDTLTYSLVSGPTHGALTGTIPNYTYTPDAGYTGADSFTFKANDGSLDSNTATISITVVAPVIYLRANTDTPAGNDVTGIINDPTHPYQTAQKVHDVIQLQSTTMPIIVDVGVGSFGNITLSGNFGYNVTWRGVSRATSVIGNISGTGAAGTLAWDDFMGGNGPPGNGSDGYNVTITSDANVAFGSIVSTGGVGGDGCACPSYPSGGNGGNGGSIRINANASTGIVNSMPGAGGNYDPGNGGSQGPSGGSGLISVYGTVAGVSSYGVVHIYSGGVATNNIGVAGGNVTVHAGATTRDVIVNGYGDINVGGTNGGSVTVEGTVNGEVIALGGDDYGSMGGTGGAGGTIVIETTGVVTGAVDASGGGNYIGNLKGNGGTITIKGSVGSYAYAKAGGGDVSSPGGTGGNITVTSTGSVGATVSVDGSASDMAGGNAGTVTIAGQVLDVSANGGYSENVQGGNGGFVIVQNGGQALDISAVGGASNFALAGSGGTILVNTGGLTRDLSVDGGDSGATSGGNAGSVTVQASATTGHINAIGGDSVSNPGGNGGSVTVDGAAISYYDPTPIVIDTSPGASN